MSRAVHNDVLDAALAVMAGDCDRITFCVGQPATYAEAVTAPGTGKMLVDHALTGGDFSIGDAADGGRELVIASQADTVSNSGIGNHVALVDTATSRLLYVTPASEQQVVAGRAFEFPEWRIRLSDPAAP